MIDFVRRGLAMTLLCGRPANLANRPGQACGAKVDPVGTLNVPSWLGEMINYIEAACTYTYNMCCVIITYIVCTSDILGEKADIHTGGVDLKFPHHDNEIAQAEVQSVCPVALHIC